MLSSPTHSSTPLAVVTCGPAHSPIDEVRRITNFATGEIGAILSRALLDAGWRVVCLRGEGSTFPAPAGVDVRSFSTNDSLVNLFQSLDETPDAIFHAAALCDFQVAEVSGLSGAKKISSQSGDLNLRLVMAPKVLPRLREWFPDAHITGWKYELDGDRTSALKKASQQIRECRTNACVVNGSAYGGGFGILSLEGSLQEVRGKSELAAALAIHPPAAT